MGANWKEKGRSLCGPADFWLWVCGDGGWKEGWGELLGGKLSEGRIEAAMPARRPCRQFHLQDGRPGARFGESSRFILPARPFHLLYGWFRLGTVLIKKQNKKNKQTKTVLM